MPVKKSATKRTAKPAAHCCHCEEIARLRAEIAGLRVQLAAIPRTYAYPTQPYTYPTWWTITPTVTTTSSGPYETSGYCQIVGNTSVAD